MTLELRYERCVRTRSMSASCQRCVDACPTRAVSLGGPRRSVEVALDDCVECGVCQAVCPTEAFGGVVAVQALVAGRPTEVACGRGGVPCVGALSPDELLTLALEAGRLRVSARSCSAGAVAHERARISVEQAQRLAAAAGLGVTLVWREEGGAEQARPQERPVAARRRLLGRLVPGMSKGKLSSPVRLDVAAIRETVAPARRQRLLAALAPRVSKVATAAKAATPSSGGSKRSGDEAGAISAAVEFIGSLRIDASSCTACALCVSACPTGALEAPPGRQEIRFDARACTGCGLCQDVCEPKAISCVPELEVAALWEEAPRVLISAATSQCGECGAPFRAEAADEGRCPACRERQSEARALWGPR